MADSYNELMGIGSHSEDANMECWLPCQDDAASTVVDDQSSNSLNGTLVGGDNTSDLATTGPNSYLTSALELDGTNDYISVTGATGSVFSFVRSGGEGTALARIDPDSVGGTLGTYADARLLWNKGNDTGTANEYEWAVGLEGGKLYARTFGGNNNGNSPTVSIGSWQNVAVLFDAGTDCEAYVDGSSNTESVTDTSANNGSWDVHFGSNPYATNDYDGTVCDIVLFSRLLTSGELGQWENGPELNYSSGVSFASDGTYDVGTWALPSPFASGSNGTATYEVIAVNAAGDVLDSDTSTSSSLAISSESGNTVYLLVRATNTGGYDIGDYDSRTSSYGSANDGYYEIASVTAASGGGSTVVRTSELAMSNSQEISQERSINIESVLDILRSNIINSSNKSTLELLDEFGLENIANYQSENISTYDYLISNYGDQQFSVSSNSLVLDDEIIVVEYQGVLTEILVSSEFNIDSLVEVLNNSTVIKEWTLSEGWTPGTKTRKWILNKRR